MVDSGLAGLMHALVTTKPLVGLQLYPLAPTLQRIAVGEMGQAPLPLFLLLGQLARYEDIFPRTKTSVRAPRRSNSRA